MPGIAARKENGIASLAYDPGIHMDFRFKFGK
ncbi:hypothetical protein GGQ85_001311 [Nitrobacter vulgaris]|jgi:hypothetical protein|nr:hypothetical protein [Nitrobacter vulgaris]